MVLIMKRITRLELKVLRIFSSMINWAIHGLITLFVAICILSTNFVWAQNSYYIDSQNGNDNNDGLSENTAWKSHTMVESANLQPGEVVHFARESSWTGGIQINASGSEGSPIIFTNYGTGDLPKFSNPDWGNNTGNAIRFNGDYLIADGLYFHDVPPPPAGDFITVWSAGALRILLGADHCIIRNCYFDTVPKAVQSHGEYTLITYNTMIGEQVLLGSQYWGPIGIHLGIGNQEVSYNTIREFWVTEGHAWGGDGGAIEMDDGRNHKDNVYIHHNRTINNCGFLEISYDYDIEHREVWNLRVAFNLSTDFQSIGFLEAPLHDSYIDNNTFDRTHQLHYNSSMEVQLGDPIVRNNLIIVAGVSPYRADDGQLHVTPQNNWYYQVNNPNLVYFPGSAAGNGDPGLINFVNAGDSDYHLTEDSPLRGTGQNLSSEFYSFYSTDFEGKALPNSGVWDVGALQYEKALSITSTDLGKVLDQYRLEQNYPNPFNSQTMINYRLPVDSAVDLTIYNILGQKVVTLLSGNQKAGDYKVAWNASNHSSGIYTYRLQADNYYKTRKMLLFK